ncbi:helix-turn-helix transcriptional regulator [Lichenifustis flavocetrariae]|uniref:Helix-turn-helix transcriptional regulator n=1 Tax=Lichenifustis flavocetrariae TaxID=2949735 RepID=A0AA41YZY4_9HYPH|nr:helix-turn-helix transcriptional regulator [Lichenifustis flavocetrariae]MCW6506777.1 helix-turn-helix transcriptional regulator [Lichenifustis flavocetrariae]
MPTDEPDAGSVLVVAHELNRAQIPSPCVIGSFFGLTPAEARLAYEMAHGDGLGACARRLGITPNTARTHLKHVFEKTGTRRQAELLRLLLSCGFSLADCSPAATNVSLRAAGRRRA